MTAGFNWRALLGFELCWFALVYFQQLAVLPVLVYVLYGLSQLTKVARAAVLLIMLTGVVVDTILLQLAIIQFTVSSWIPFWFIVLWAVFALAAVEFMAKVLVRPWLAAVLGASGGPLSYWMGAALSNNALQFPLGIYSVIALIPVWAVIAIALGQSRRFYVKAC